LEGVEILLDIKDYSMRGITGSFFKPPCKEDIYNKIEILSDNCVINCENGNIKINKLLLSQNSQFIFTRFTEYKGENPDSLDLKEYSKEVVNEYIRFLVTGNVNLEIVLENISESFYLSTYLQDYKYVNFLYELSYANIGFIETYNITREIFPSSKK
jgi:hypothetical protein